MTIVQQRPDELIDILRADFQARYEPNFAWKSVCSQFLALPALRAFWPMSSVSYLNASRCIDLSGQGLDLRGFGTAGEPTFGYTNLAPYADFNSADNQYLLKVDGGAANWADITGAEVYIQAAQRGLTLGGWFQFDSVVSEPLISKWLANNLSYILLYDVIGRLRFRISANGVATTDVNSGTIPNLTDWYFVVGRFTPSTELAIFINNVGTLNVAAMPATIFDGTANFIIGYASAVGNYFDGRASLCFLCAAALSDAIIGQLWQQSRALFGV